MWYANVRPKWNVTTEQVLAVWFILFFYVWNVCCCYCMRKQTNKRAVKRNGGRRARPTCVYANGLKWNERSQLKKATNKRQKLFIPFEKRHNHSHAHSARRLNNTWSVRHTPYTHTCSHSAFGRRKHIRDLHIHTWNPLYKSFCLDFLRFPLYTRHYSQSRTDEAEVEKFWYRWGIISSVGEVFTNTVTRAKL